MRRRDRIKGLRRKNIAVFDVETWGLVPKNFGIGVVMWVDKEGNEVSRRFSDPKEMRDFIFSRRFKGYTFYGHNVEYDLLSILDDGVFEFFSGPGDRIIYNQKFVVGKKRVGKKDLITVADSYNLFQSSLSSMGKAIGLEKLERPSKFEVGIPTEITEDDWRYCEQDCRIVLRSILAFRRWIFENFGCNVGLTIASTSLRVWLSNWGLDVDVEPEVNELYRRSYYGGRTEIFVKGTIHRRLNYYDVNSLYPSVYSTIRFPDPRVVRRGKGRDRLIRVLKDERYEGVASVTWSCPSDLRYPVLPVRMDGKLIFPVGTKVEGTYTFLELRYALQNGYTIDDCDEFLFSPSMASPFKSYVDVIYGKRMECKMKGDKAGDVFCKFLLNSLYGKFGEVRDESEFGTWDSPSEKHLNEGWFFDEIRDGYGYWRPRTGRMTYTDHTIFSFASYVTSGARVRLHGLLVQAGDVYYCDTDSVITSSELPTGKGLGELKLEYTIDELIILKPKQYHIVDGQDEKGEKVEIVRYKGIPRKDLPSSIFQKRIEVKRYYRSREALRRGNKAGTVAVVTKENNYEEGDKRIFDTNIDLNKTYVYGSPIIV